MRKSKEYKGLRFTSKAILDIFRFFDRFLLTDYHKRYEVKELTTEMCGIIWEHFSDEAIFGAYIPWVTNLTYKRTFLDYEFMLFTQEKSTYIGVKAHTLMQIQPIFDEVERNIPNGTISLDELLPSIRPFIIMGHGKGSAWKSVVDYLYVRHGYAFRCFEVQPDSYKGLDRAMKDTTLENIMVLLVIEKNDFYGPLRWENQQTIINTLDYLEKTIDNSRILFIVEEGIDLPRPIKSANIIKFNSGHVKEVFLQIAGTIRKEFV